MRSFNRFDDPDDPAMQPVYEAGGGESEGFELAEEELIENATHENEGGTSRIFQHADDNDAELLPGEELPDAAICGEADEARDPGLGAQPSDEDCDEER